MRFDDEFRKKHGIIAGIDEAGRGPLAGPVVAAAVILQREIPGLYDSKSLSKKEREFLFSEILNSSIVGIGFASEEEIDLFNILKATRLAMTRAVSRLSLHPDYVLIDGRSLSVNIRGTCIVSGDKKSASIAAASIIAKVTRDRIMEKLDELFPYYGFNSHKGYGTQAHLEALRKNGPSLWHRLTFKPVKELLTREKVSVWLKKGLVSEKRLFRTGIL
ncbi:ribonuclease HII [Kosmotoga arenicorallina S304]|uniref:Ribonuclease HII n=2 Tax=Kosmotoga arenicorallina TaxID=688066 RepID=A0A176JWE2_9BACT|nr:ribonuclease HII [Kosmotoga arenicorallina S304]